MKKKLTLKEAREQGKIQQFIKERENEPPGDAARLEKAIESAVKTSSANQKALSQDDSSH